MSRVPSVIGSEKYYKARIDDEMCVITLNDEYFMFGDKKHNYIDVQEIERLENDSGNSYYEAIIGSPTETKRERIQIDEDEEEFEEYFISLIQEYREIDDTIDEEMPETDNQNSIISEEGSSQETLDSISSNITPEKKEKKEKKEEVDKKIDPNWNKAIKVTEALAKLKQVEIEKNEMDTLEVKKQNSDDNEEYEDNHDIDDSQTTIDLIQTETKIEEKNETPSEIIEDTTTSQMKVFSENDEGESEEEPNISSISDKLSIEEESYEKNISSEEEDSEIMVKTHQYEKLDGDKENVKELEQETENQRKKELERAIKLTKEDEDLLKQIEFEDTLDIDFEEIEKELEEVGEEKIDENVPNLPFGRILGVFSGIVDDIKTQIIVKEDFLFVNDVEDYKIKYVDIERMTKIEENDDYCFYELSILPDKTQKWVVEKNDFEFDKLIAGLVKVHSDLEMEKVEEENGVSVLQSKETKKLMEIEDHPDNLHKLRVTMLSGDLEGFKFGLMKHTLSRRDLCDLLVHSIYSHRLEFVSAILSFCTDIHLDGSLIQTSIEYFYFEPVYIIVNHKANIGAKDFYSLHVSAVKKEDVKNLEGMSLDETDNEGWTAMHLCCVVGNIHLLKRLLDCGANTEIKDKEDFRTPLHLAVIFNRIEAVKMLINHHADVYAETLHDFNILHLAAKFGRVEILDFLLSAKKGSITQK